jgi:phage terminase small subunit
MRWARLQAIDAQLPQRWSPLDALEQTLAEGGTLAQASEAADLPPRATGRLARRNAERIIAMKREALRLADITPEKTLLELGRVAFSDVRGLYDADGQLLSPAELDDDAAAAVASFEDELRYEGRGDDKVPVRVRKVKRADKIAALGILARHHKIVGEVGDGVSALASALADRLNATRPPVAIIEEVNKDETLIDLAS